MARPARRIRRCICRSGPRSPAASTTALSVSRAVARTSDTSAPSASFIAASSGEMSGASASLPRSSPRLGDAFQLLALEAVQPVRPERVDRVGQQQHLDPLGAEAFELRRGFQRLGAVAGQVPDRVLAGLHAVERIRAARSSRPASRNGTAAAARVRVRCSVSSHTPSFSRAPKFSQNFA